METSNVDTSKNLGSFLEEESRSAFETMNKVESLLDSLTKSLPGGVEVRAITTDLIKNHNGNIENLVSEISQLYSQNSSLIKENSNQKRELLKKSKPIFSLKKPEKQQQNNFKKESNKISEELLVEGSKSSKLTLQILKLNEKLSLKQKQIQTLSKKLKEHKIKKPIERLIIDPNLAGEVLVLNQKLKDQEVEMDSMALIIDEKSEILDKHSKIFLEVNTELANLSYQILEDKKVISKKSEDLVKIKSYVKKLKGELKVAGKQIDVFVPDPQLANEILELNNEIETKAEEIDLMSKIIEDKEEKLEISTKKQKSTNLELSIISKQLNDSKSLITNYTYDISDKKKSITNLNSQISRLSNLLSKTQNEVSRLEDIPPIDPTKTEQFKGLESLLSERSNLLDKTTTKFISIKAELSKTQSLISQYESEISKKDEIIVKIEESKEDLESKLKIISKEVLRLENIPLPDPKKSEEFLELKKNLSKKDKLILDGKKLISQYESEISKKSKLIEDKEKKLEISRGKLSLSNLNFSQVSNILEENNGLIKNYKSQITSKTNSVVKLKCEISKLSTSLYETKDEIQRLENLSEIDQEKINQYQGLESLLEKKSKLLDKTKNKLSSIESELLNSQNQILEYETEISKKDEIIAKVEELKKELNYKLETSNEKIQRLENIPELDPTKTAQYLGLEKNLEDTILELKSVKTKLVDELKTKTIIDTNNETDSNSQDLEEIIDNSKKKLSKKIDKKEYILDLNNLIKNYKLNISKKIKKIKTTTKIILSQTNSNQLKKITYSTIGFVALLYSSNFIGTQSKSLYETGNLTPKVVNMVKSIENSKIIKNIHDFEHKIVDSISNPYKNQNK